MYKDKHNEGAIGFIDIYEYGVVFHPTFKTLEEGMNISCFTVYDNGKERVADFIE
ncbi:MAG: hypothetical protein JW904_10845 [Spirochaetales bacterium]|nr:hypothetical protein [Spirochaetales bacterium]